MLKTIVASIVVSVTVSLTVAILTTQLSRLKEWAIAWTIRLWRRYHPTNRQIRAIESMCWEVQKNPRLIDQSAILDPWKTLRGD